MTHQQDVAARIAQLRREKSAREHRDVLQKEIAKAAKLSVVTYGRYESGQRKVPDEVVLALAEFFETTPWFIRYGYNPEAPVQPVEPQPDTINIGGLEIDRASIVRFSDAELAEARRQIAAEEALELRAARERQRAEEETRRAAKKKASESARKTGGKKKRRP